MTPSPLLFVDEFSRHNQEAAASSFDMTSVSREAVVGSGVLSCFQGGMVIESPLEERMAAHGSGLVLSVFLPAHWLGSTETSKKKPQSST